MDSRKFGKLAVFTMVGAFIAAAIYFVLAFGALGALQSRSGRSPESYLGIAFLILLPSALLIGSAVTGFLSYPHVQTKLGFLGVTPGLYMSLCILFSNVVMAGPEFAVGMLLPALLWTLLSLAGVGLGAYLNSRRKTVGNDS
ncbi:MAG: hypothetical protein IT364_09945 [Candidatus Hydrogenedentes bacterium]|nr:hypothetical protein [Candidatus Hydrogenedentota bacterium]